MATATYNVSINCAGVIIQRLVSRAGDHPNTYEIALPAGKDVTAWVKTDADTAACDLPAGHAYTNGNFDVYWQEASVDRRRYGVTGTIITNALSLDGGAGDDFPASATTGVVVTRQVAINTAIDGDAIQLIGICLKFTDRAIVTNGHVTFKDVGAAVIAQVDLEANIPQAWDIAGGTTNIFTGNPITAAYASNGNSTTAATLQILSLEDASP